eukprot:2966372-Amphidinium_carterae.2
MPSKRNAPTLLHTRISDSLTGSFVHFPELLHCECHAALEFLQMCMLRGATQLRETTLASLFALGLDGNEYANYTTASFLCCTGRFANNCNGSVPRLSSSAIHALSSEAPTRVYSYHQITRMLRHSAMKKHDEQVYLHICTVGNWPDRHAPLELLLYQSLLKPNIQ